MTARDLVATLVEQGPISYRCITFGCYNPDRIPLDEIPIPKQSSARRLATKWNNKLWAILPRPEPDEDKVIKYLFALNSQQEPNKRKTPRYLYAKHEDLCHALFFAHYNCPGLKVHHWAKVEEKVYTRADDTKWRHTPDRYALLEIEGKMIECYFELERTRKNKHDTKDNMDWYRVAREQKVISEDSEIVWVASDEADRDWLRGLAGELDKDPHLWFTTLTEILTDPARRDIYKSRLVTRPVARATAS